MPLIISGSGPTAGTLDPGLSLSDRLALIPNLIGAFDPAALTAGAVSSWPAAIGAGVLDQPTLARQPARSLLGAIPVITNASDDYLRSSGTWGAAQQLTVAIRAYLADATIDQQNLFGGSDTFKLRWRNTGNWQFLGSPITTIPGSGNGWHTIILSQSASNLSIDINGAVTNVASTGADTLGMYIGDTLLSPGPNATGFGWRGSYGRVVIAQSATHGTAHYDTIREWLEA